MYGAIHSVIIRLSSGDGAGLCSESESESEGGARRQGPGPERARQKPGLAISAPFGVMAAGRDVLPTARLLEPFAGEAERRGQARRQRMVHSGLWLWEGLYAMLPREAALAEAPLAAAVLGTDPL